MNSIPPRLPSSPKSLYERVIGQDWERLPGPLRELHGVADRAVFEGEAKVETGRGFLACCVRVLMRFPKAADRVPVKVTIERRGEAEQWTREFGRQRFRSVLSAPDDGARGVVVERFGTLRFRVSLPVDRNGLNMPVQSASWLGLALPRWLTPTSVTSEMVDAHGRFYFDVDIGLPGIGRIVRYRGWLTPRIASG